MKINGIVLPRAGARLRALYNECLELCNGKDQRKVIVDVGSDHGYLACLLAKSNRYKKVIATDISKPSLDKTLALALSEKLDVDCRVGDGLMVSPDADIAAICGMGGWEIVKILDDSPNIRNLVLQPVQNHVELRQFLIKNHYKITKDYVVEDKGKFYYIIVTNGSGRNFYTKTQKLLGKCKKDQTYLNYLYKEQKLLSFLENFDITSMQGNKKDIKQKQKYYRLLKKLISKGI